MTDGRDLWLLLPAPLRRLPADLAAVVVLTALTFLAVFVPVINETPLRIVLGLPFVLFLPGYAFVAALFPEAGEPPEAVGEDGSIHEAIRGNDAADAELKEVEAADGGLYEGVRDRGIDGIERVALAFGLSIAVVPLLGLVLNFTPWGIRLTPIMIAVGGFTLACTAVAAHRRSMLPPAERFRVPYDEWIAAAHAEIFEPDTRADAALNVLLALSIVLATASVGYAIMFPQPGEQFTEFYVLTEDDDGELVAADYPTEFVQGEPESLVLGVGNHEHDPVDYEIVVELQRVELHEVQIDDADDEAEAQRPNTTTEVEVLEREELARFYPHVEHNETWHRQIELAPTMTGEEMRLQFLLYEGEAPPEPTAEDAYRDLHLWVNVTEPER